jgi:hypothetical protein
MTVRVRVVVPVRAEHTADLGRLDTCLAALDRQTLPRADREVVVVDDGSPADVPGTVAAHPGVRLLRVPARGSYAARNAGARGGAAPVLAFTDADCVPEPTWLAAALAALDAAPGLAAVAGAIDVPVTPACGPVALHDALTAFPQREFVRRFGFGATANLVVRRAAFEAVGPFDPALRSGGDAEWGARAAAAGRPTGYRDEVRVVHPPRRAIGEVGRKAVRTTRGVEELAAARGDAEPLRHALADRLARPWRELPALLADPRVPGPARRAQVFGVALAHAGVVAAETVRSRARLRHAGAAPGDDCGLDALVAATLLAAAAALAAAARTRPSPDTFGDGAAYRRMARGEPGAPPFHRRVVGPALVRALVGGDRTAAFQAVALVGVAAGSIGTGLLAGRAARESGAPPNRSRRAALLAAALVPTMPHSTRMAVHMPPFNDQLAVAAGTAWLLLATGPRRTRPTAPAAAALAGLTREQWLLVSTAALPARGRARIAHLAACAAAAAVILSRPAGPGSEVYPPRVALRRWLTGEGLCELGWGLASTLGPLPLLLPAAARRAEGSTTLRALLRIGAVQTGLALVGGSDTPRLVHGGLPFLVAAAVGPAVAAGDRRLAPVVAGALALWRPGARPRPSAASYERFHLPYMHGLLGRRAVGGVARVAAAVALVNALRRR